MQVTAETTAREIAEHAKRQSPITRFAYCSNAVAIWQDERGWVAMIERTIMESAPWIRTDVREFLVNGKPFEREWVEVTGGESGVDNSYVLETDDPAQQRHLVAS